MSQYQPVSLNTIRAAIMWGGLPTPRLKQVWVFSPPNRPAWSTVHAYFSLAEICKKCSLRPLRYTGPDDLVPFRRQLSGCFARDITVVAILVELAQDKLVAMLSCSVYGSQPEQAILGARRPGKSVEVCGADRLNPIDPFPLHDGHE